MYLDFQRIKSCLGLQEVFVMKMKAPRDTLSRKATLSRKLEHSEINFSISSRVLQS